jgi:hypothetical protein
MAIINRLCCTDGEDYWNWSVEGTIGKSARTVPGNERIAASNRDIQIKMQR